MSLLQPESSEAMAAALVQAARDRQTIETGGAFTKIRAGGPRGTAQVNISTAKLDRVLNYEPRDLTISVEAGMPIAELSALLAKNQQMIPLDPPFAPKATIGGVIATNSSGPRRRWFGTGPRPRHWHEVRHHGRQARAIGRHGGKERRRPRYRQAADRLARDLGVITVLNFKLLPKPVGSRTFAREFETVAEAVAERDRILKSTLQPMALDLLNPAASGNGFQLLLEAGGESAVLDRYARELPGFAAIDGEIWPRISNYTEGFIEAHPQGCVIRVSSKLTEATKVLSTFTGPVIMRAGNGVAYAYCETMPAVMPSWKCVVEYAPDARPAATTLWPAPGPDFDLMRRVKDMMDHHRLLNPGRLYGRL